MSTFDDILAADAVNAFLGEFAEEVIYTPHTPTKDNPRRAIQAMVVRDPPAPILGASQNWISVRMTVRVLNDAVNGISSEQLNTGGDTITVAYRIGTPAKPYPIHSPQPGSGGMDPAMLTLELR